MMELTIITINRNNATGLEKTMQSVLNQSCKSFEYVVVDGASTDSSVEVIQRFAMTFGKRIKWISEPDNGIYNAMNKGIRMANGEYIQFLNSGDCIAGEEIVEKVLIALEEKQRPSILYGNMLKVFPDGTIQKDRSFAGANITFLGFYRGTLNHSSAYIQHNLFEKYGLYDESLKIVSDWKWFLRAIIFGEERPIYSDINITSFDMTGISETNKKLTKCEREKVLTEIVPATILADYDELVFLIDQMKRLKRHPWAYNLVFILERYLFKLEKQRIKKTKTIRYQ